VAAGLAGAGEASLATKAEAADVGMSCGKAWESGSQADIPLRQHRSWAEIRPSASAALKSDSVKVPNGLPFLATWMWASLMGCVE